MSFDGVFTHAMISELRTKLIGGRVSKISQPYPNEVIITIRANRKNQPLLLSAHSSYARAQITNIPYSNPKTPTNFTMMLRKYLESGQLVAIDQIANDRIINFSFLTRNELGDEQPLILSLEMMGRYSNCLLINPTNDKVLDTIKHISSDQNRYRMLIPGATYRQPPAQDKLNPFKDTSDAFKTLLSEFPNKEVLAKELQNSYQGLAGQSSLDLATALHTNVEDPSVSWSAFFKQFDTPTPTILSGKRLDFSAIPNKEIGTGQEFDSLSEMLDTYYLDKANKDRVQQQGSHLIRVVKNELKKNRGKQKKLEKTLKNTETADQLRVQGELLTTYLHLVKQGMTEVSLPNFYDNEKEMTIQLSNQISPSKNAQKYFKKYQKQKNAVIFVNEQLLLNKKEIAYLEEIQSEIELAEPKDLPDIKIELQQQGLLKEQKLNKNKKAIKIKISKPDEYYATDGTLISVGKNNLQNDQLTMKTANKSDIWLHAKNIPGSHVIIHSSNPSDETVTEAANLAAYFSKYRQSASVPVDYIQVKRIKKPNGSKPGFVVYEGQNSTFITPDSQKIMAMRRK
ncbi:NFACT RNA binding domain-containing protein [Dellaglioa sp. P0083]|uniref:NFACT RNA binding domain-containing protein n=1 Tax=Dellaglioa kimchii TaxID=3344667 RepID=UPI0038D4051A